MGLDMYLTGKRYIWSDERNKIRITGLPVKHEIKSVDYDMGYWRKANAIHNWFVENVQNGEDNCAEYYVSREQLQELYKVVTAVLESTELIEGVINNGYTYENGEKVYHKEVGKVMADDSVAQELLPTSSGFFFGNTDYNEWYYEDLKETKKMLLEALEADKQIEFYYQSSW